jgi:hypothetical protein
MSPIEYLKSLIAGQQDSSTPVQLTELKLLLKLLESRTEHYDEKRRDMPKTAAFTFPPGEDEFHVYYDEHDLCVEMRMIVAKYPDETALAAIRKAGEWLASQPVRLDKT